MKKNAPYTLNIDMSLAEDMSTCTCKCVTTVGSETVLAALLTSAVLTSAVLTSAVVAIAHDHSCNPHKFAEAMCATLMEFIDKPGFTKPNQKLS